MPLKLYLKLIVRVLNCGPMSEYFVPFKGRSPATVAINGHQIVLLAEGRGVFDDTHGLLEADQIKEVSVGPSSEEKTRVISELARSINGGVVIVPPEASLEEVFKTLAQELPWVQ